MAHLPIPEPEREWQDHSAPHRSPAPDELDELVARFAKDGGLPIDAAVDLALEVVLHQAAEQACNATGANGAAVILERGGEMICRASTGSAPELGTRLAAGGGLTVECLRTGRPQHCDDAALEAQADAEACRSLGVRSVMVLPLWNGGTLAGVLEVFSSRIRAFGDREQSALNEVAAFIVANLRRADKSFDISAPANIRPGPDPEVNVSSSDLSAEAEFDPDENASRPSTRRVVFITYSLAAGVMSAAVLLVVLFLLRFMGRPNVRHSSKNGPSVATAPAANLEAAPAGTSPPTASTGKNKDSQPASIANAPAAGSLSVYENGKEIFHLPPSRREPLELSQREAEANLLRRVEPDYPGEARQRQIQGPVVLNVFGAPDGRVENVEFISGPPILADPAIAAVKQWQFRPQGVRFLTQVTLTFTLAK
ncbi:MAG TPA: TonB family protein [Candidatus Binatia bacterium]|nr:TonB family protein [Candidatus Binatia bacterium]